MANPVTVGELRFQCARVDSSTPVLLTSLNPEVSAILSQLVITGVYPDTTDENGKFVPTFKIRVSRKDK